MGKKIDLKIVVDKVMYFDGLLKKK